MQGDVKRTASLTIPETSRLCYVKRSRQRFIANLLQCDFSYARKLSMHSSCVNSLTFSNDGRWLASAGDDPYVYLWDFNRDDLNKPSHAFRGPRENIFALEFSASRQNLYSGDTDCMIYRYDMNRLSASLTNPERYAQSYVKHEDNIRSISCHPELDDVFLSASEDGKLLLHDGRASNSITRAQATLQNASEFAGAQYHPTIPHLFVTGDKAGCAHLRDIRMTFGPSSSRSNDGIVHTYLTTLSKTSAGHLCQPEISSLTFDRNGSKLAITFLGYLPTIYSISDSLPVAVCSGDAQPDGKGLPIGERSYSNCCTIKHGSFGGPGLDNDDYYAAGSDDFRGYVWKIPPISELVLQRQVITDEKWYSTPIDFIAFADNLSSERYLPLELTRPHCRLGGHKSIVNSALWHPHWPYLVTAGVERHIWLHSATPNTPCGVDLEFTDDNVRALPGPNTADRRRMIRALTHGREEDDNDDMDTIALFDEILRSEGSMDIFASRRWSPILDSDFEEPEDST